MVREITTGALTAMASLAVSATLTFTLIAADQLVMSWRCVWEIRDRLAEPGERPNDNSSGIGGRGIGLFVSPQR